VRRERREDVLDDVVLSFDEPATVNAAILSHFGVVGDRPADHDIGGFAIDRRELRMSAKRLPASAAGLRRIRIDLVQLGFDARNEVRCGRHREGAVTGSFEQLFLEPKSRTTPVSSCHDHRLGIDCLGSTASCGGVHSRELRRRANTSLAFIAAGLSESRL